MRNQHKKQIHQYGKSMADILMFKQDFFKNNEKLLSKNSSTAELYMERPRRLSCKLCNTALPEESYFTSHGLEYYLCACGHLNGKYVDDKTFCDALYLREAYGNTYKEPHSEEYIARVDSIYIPKVRFLINSLCSVNIKYRDYKYLDIGAGSGYMVSALKRNGLTAKGIEVSSHQVEYGNKMIGEALLEVELPSNIAKSIATTDYEVVSFVGVLEHIEDISNVLNAIKTNKNIKYIFFSVPMFSLSCVFEAVFPNVFNRHLGGAHTHLFSKDSLNWMYSHYDFTVIATWDFGTDIMDLYRSLVVTLSQNGAHEDFIDHIHNVFQENTDVLQMIIDKSSFSSETHVIVKVNH